MAYQRRSMPQADVAFGSDSFLDVVTNVVGILIILVVVVGLRVKNAPALGLTPRVDFAPHMAEHDAVEQDVVELSNKVLEIDAEAAQKKAERDALAVVVAQLEQQLAQRRAQLDSGRQASFDLERQLAVARDQLGRAERQLAAAASAPSKSVTVLNYPTPISRTVEGIEIHFQLRGGKIKHVPLDELIAMFKREAEAKVHRLRDRPELVSTVGPVEGFKLQYTLERVDLTSGGHAGSSYAQLVEWTLKPQSPDLGEILAVALSPGSELERVLARHPARKATVTLWVYPESFAEFRALKQWLYERGYAAACRPLPAGIEIGGSPSGTKSVAE